MEQALREQLNDGIERQLKGKRPLAQVRGRGAGVGVGLARGRAFSPQPLCRA
jgi:hypothetical protein